MFQYDILGSLSSFTCVYFVDKNNEWKLPTDRIAHLFIESMYPNR